MRILDSAKPLISVITVTFNSEKFLEDTIRSVIGQDYPNIEYIIIDGGSTDRTLEIIKKYEGNISQWISEPDSGLYDAMNKGIDLCHGELIGIINSDDYYETGVLSLVADAYVENPEHDVFHGNLMYLDENSQILNISKPKLNYNRIWDQMIFRHPTCFVKRSLYQRCGRFNLQYPITADYELFLRFYKMGAQFYYLDHVLAYMRKGGYGDQRIREAILERREIVIKHGLTKFKAYFDYYHNLFKFSYQNFFKKIKVKTN